MLDPARSYDLIGDVHGCALTLEHLLDRLGYHKQAGVWRHASRMAVFVGDIIDLSAERIYREHSLALFERQETHRPIERRSGFSNYVLDVGRWR